MLTPKQRAFDAAVKALADFDYPGIADLEQIRSASAHGAALVGDLVVLRDAFNAALAVEGQHLREDAPHQPVYLDYLESPRSNAKAFRDSENSFIGITVPLFLDMAAIAAEVAADDDVVAAMHLPADADRRELRGALLWMLYAFVVGHELTHHTHGHLLRLGSERRRTSRLWMQAREADADGWSAYMTLNHWVLAEGRRGLVALLKLDAEPHDVRDAALFATFVVAQAAFTFVREPQAVNKDTVYWQTHPIQPMRLNLVSRYVMKFIGEFMPSARPKLTQAWYQTAMDAVSRVMWTRGKHAERWREQAAFLRTPDGAAYKDALLREVDDFRALLRQRDDSGWLEN